MDYEEILNAIYYHLICKPGVDTCGAESQKALDELEKLFEEQTNLDFRAQVDLVAQVTAGYAENAENGFYYGFQCAITLLTGNKRNQQQTPFNLKGKAGNYGQDHY